MNGRSLLIIGVLTLSSLGIASAKSYDVTLVNRSKAGTSELAPGDYKVKVEGTQATFTGDHSKSITVPVKIEHGNKKFEYTTVQSTSQGGMDHIQSINLGGSDTTIELGQ